MSKYEFEEIISEFQKIYPRPGLKDFKLNWYDIESEWPKSWPSGEMPGVYMFFDSTEEILYIGKASSGRRLRTRLRAYFKNKQGICQIKGKAKDTRYVGLLAIPFEHGFEAPAIEEYLITYCSKKSEKYPKLRNKIIVAKQAKRQFNKQIQEWANEQLKTYEKDPDSVPENIRNMIINWKKQNK
jgi:hypothetical protein